MASAIHNALLAERRPPTGLLHCSSHSWQPLRFTQLEQVLDVEPESDFGSLYTMAIGTMSHKWLEAAFEEDGVFGPDWVLSGTEVDLTDDLPDGWTGTADYVFFHKPTHRFVIGDLKTTKPEAMQYLGSEPKIEHRIQVSCYHAAWVQARYNVDPNIFICYLPKGKAGNQTVLPRVISTPAIPREEIFGRLQHIKFRVDQYVAEYEATGELDNKFLEPMPKPELKLSWNGKLNGWDLKQGPTWYEAYLTGGLPEFLVPRTPTRKVGFWSLDGYYSAKYDAGVSLDDIPRPDRYEMERRRG